MKVYDASGKILGRLSTTIAKDLLKGEFVHVVNCEGAMISGNPKFTVKHYKERRERGDPHHGPFFPKTPVGIFRRAVRGMLPRHKPRGRDAMRRLRVHVGFPKELKGERFSSVKGANASELRCKSMTIGDLALALGAKKRW